MKGINLNDTELFNKAKKYIKLYYKTDDQLWNYKAGQYELELGNRKRYDLLGQLNRYSIKMQLTFTLKYGSVRK